MAKDTSRTSLNGILFLLFFAILPFFQFESLLDDGLLPRYLLTALFTILLTVLNFKSLQKGIRVHRRLFLVSAFFLLWQFASIAWAYNPVEALGQASRYAALIPFLWIVSHLLRTEALQSKELGRAAALMGGIVALSTAGALLQALGEGAFFDDIYSISGNFSHKNLLSAVLLLTFPLVLLRWKREKGLLSWLSLLIALLILIEISVLRTRGIWIATLGAGGLTLVLFQSRKPSAHKTPWKPIVAGVILMLVILGGLFSAPEIKTGLTDQSNLSKRFTFWSNSMEMIAEHPWSGVGMGNWKLLFPKYGLEGVDDSAMQGVTHIQRPHNDYLWFWAELGPLGLLAYLALFVLAIRSAWRVINRKEGNSGAIYLYLFGLFAFAIFSLSDFPTERAPHLVMLMLFLALLTRKDDLEEKPILASPLVAAFVVLVTAGASWVHLHRWQGEEAMQAVLAANKEQNAPLIIEEAEAAIRPFYNVDPYANPIRYYSSLGLLATRQVDQGKSALREAQEAAPYNILVLHGFGNAYGREGKLDSALLYLDRALAIAPHFKMALLLKGDLLIQAERFPEALATLNQHDPSSTDRRYLQNLAYALRGTLDGYGTEHQRFPDMMEHLQQQGPLNGPLDYVNAYRAKRGVAPIRS